MYKPLFVGVPRAVFFTIRCAQRRGDGELGILTRDCLRLIFALVWRDIARDGEKLALLGLGVESVGVCKRANAEAIIEREEDEELSQGEDEE
jgi:hypothetical protein